MTSTIKYKIWDKYKQAAKKGQEEWSYEYRKNIDVQRVYPLFRLIHLHPQDGNTEFVTDFFISHTDVPWMHHMFKCYDCKKLMPKKLVDEFKLQFVLDKYDL
jgi:hypothetical protein